MLPFRNYLGALSNSVQSGDKVIEIPEQSQDIDLLAETTTSGPVVAVAKDPKEKDKKIFSDLIELPRSRSTSPVAKPEYSPSDSTDLLEVSEQELSSKISESKTMAGSQQPEVAENKTCE